MRKEQTTICITSVTIACPFRLTNAMNNESGQTCRSDKNLRSGGIIAISPKHCMPLFTATSITTNSHESVEFGTPVCDEEYVLRAQHIDQEAPCDDRSCNARASRTLHLPW